MFSSNKRDICETKHLLKHRLNDKSKDSSIGSFLSAYLILVNVEVSNHEYIF